MNEEEGFDEEWDAEFVNELILEEERVLSSSSSSSKLNPNPNPNSIPNPNPNPNFNLLHSVTTFSSFPQSQLHYNQNNNNNHISYSPPRELSQRPSVHVDNSNNNYDTLLKPLPVSSSLPPVTRPHDDVKDREIQRLKRELGNVSEQLSNLERECFELRNVRNKKEEQQKRVSSNTAEKGVGAHCVNNANLRHVPAQKTHGIHQQSNKDALDDEIAQRIHLASSSRAIGIQTDKTDDSSNLGLNDDLPSHANVSNKLLGIWSSDQKSGRDLISKLFTACPEDIHFLLGPMSFKISEISGDSVNREGSSNAALQCQRHSFKPSEAAKISHLCCVLTEIGNGLQRLDCLIRPLVELCYLENADILCSSLTVLHIFLKHLLSSGRSFGERDNVKIEAATSHNMSEDRSLFCVTEEEESCARYRLFGTKSCFDQLTFSNNGICKIGAGLPSCVNWVSLFDFLNSVAVSETKGRARLDAVSTMNLILLRTNAFEGREMFGQTRLPIFESIAEFLKEEAESRMQKEALQLLYLLLNCPRLLIVFCSGCKDGNNAQNDDNKASTSKGIDAILEGLAGCIGGRENNIQDIELRKKAVIVVAFLASAGNSGFGILLNHKLSGEKNFLMLILQLLIWEMDVEVSASFEPVENIKARTLLMRETLILLNRIVSNQQYSAIVLRALTGSRDMACMTIDIVSRLSREDQVWRRPSNSITIQMRGSEIIDLAKQFKKRVFAYLGDKIT